MTQSSAMDTDTFWQLIEKGRADDASLDAALAELLAAHGKDEILAFDVRMDQLDTAIDRWDVWAAAYLIGGGCSDDSFMDFKAGLIALGRTWYERVVRCPDALAEHPDIHHALATGVEEAVFYEEMGYVTATAWARVTGDRDSFYPALEHYRAQHRADGEELHDMGDDFDFDDAHEMRRRLPRLAALYLGEAQQ
ncbi:DUF4240 domain-containing protein [Streptomyces sp. NPDC102467]|uniref:DUF4240 domain-containing protein n=1 Tax=Streptomyces sp. NPDC102467 TaxID=3366179 RepID=UPI00382FAFC8